MSAFAYIHTCVYIHIYTLHIYGKYMWICIQIIFVAHINQLLLGAITDDSQHCGRQSLWFDNECALRCKKWGEIANGISVKEYDDA